MADTADHRRRRRVRNLGVVVCVLGIALLAYCFYDFATAPAEEGTPTGFLLLPVGGVVALIGLALVSKSFGLVSSAFTDEEIEQHRHGPRDG